MVCGRQYGRGIFLIWFFLNCRVEYFICSELARGREEWSITDDSRQFFYPLSHQRSLSYGCAWCTACLPSPHVVSILSSCNASAWVNLKTNFWLPLDSEKVSDEVSIDQGKIEGPWIARMRVLIVAHLCRAERFSKSQTILGMISVLLLIAAHSWKSTNDLDLSQIIISSFLIKSACLSSHHIIQTKVKSRPDSSLFRAWIYADAIFIRWKAEICYFCILALVIICASLWSRFTLLHARTKIFALTRWVR